MKNIKFLSLIVLMSSSVYAGLGDAFRAAVGGAVDVVDAGVDTVVDTTDALIDGDTYYYYEGDRYVPVVYTRGYRVTRPLYIQRGGKYVHYYTPSARVVSSAKVGPDVHYGRIDLSRSQQYGTTMGVD